MSSFLMSLPLRVRRLVNGLRSTHGRRALMRGVVPAAVSQPMLKRIEPELVVDVGANRGQFSLDVAIALPSARIIAFEPLAREAKTFRRIFARRANVELRENAVGSRSGPGHLHVSGAADSSSMLQPTALQESVFPGTAEVGEIGVDVVALDESLANVPIPVQSLLKADVQGFELEVLRGGEKCLAAFGWVFLEVSFVELYTGQPLAHEVIGYLAARGFTVADTSVPSRIGGRTIQIDMLFKNQHLTAAAQSEPTEP